MNLYLRLLWVLLRGHWLPAMAFGETLVQRWRVLPNALDVNLHMDNGRYLTLVDLALVKNGWRPRCWPGANRNLP